MSDDQKRKRPPRTLRYNENAEPEYPSEPAVQEEAKPEPIPPKYGVTTELNADMIQEPIEEIKETSAVRKSPIISSRIVYNKKEPEESKLNIKEDPYEGVQIPKPKTEKIKSGEPKASGSKTKSKISEKTKAKQKEEEPDETKGELEGQINEMKNAVESAKEALNKIVDGYVHKVSQAFEEFFDRVKFIINSILLKLLKVFTVFTNALIVPILKLFFTITDAIIKGFIKAFSNFRSGMKKGKSQKNENTDIDEDDAIPSSAANSSNGTASLQGGSSKGFYNDFARQNIIFFTFRKQPVIADDAEDKENTFMENSLSDIRYCRKFVDKLPSPAEGPYAGRSIVEIFENITEEDLSKFFRYVKKNPEIFKDKNFKISEAFATWVIKKSKDSA